MKLRTKITAACLLLSCCAAAQVGYTYKPFENPGATVTRVFGMNNHGYVVGMDDSTPGRHAFLLNKKTYIPLDPTGTLGTHTSFARGVNNPGDVVDGYALSNAYLIVLISERFFKLCRAVENAKAPAERRRN